MKMKRFLCMVLVAAMLVCNMLPVYGSTIIENTQLTFEQVSFDAGWGDYATNGKETVIIASDENGEYQLLYSEDFKEFQALDYSLNDYLTFEVSEDVRAEYTSIIYFNDYYYILAIEAPYLLEADVTDETYETTILRTDGKTLTSYEGPVLNLGSLYYSAYPYFQMVGDKVVLVCDFNSLVTDSQDKTGVADYHAEYYVSEDCQQWTVYRSPEFQLTAEEASLRVFQFNGVVGDGLVFLVRGMDFTGEPSPYYGAYYTETFDQYVIMDGILSEDTSVEHVFVEIGENLYGCIKQVWGFNSEGWYVPLGLEVWISQSIDTGWNKNYSKTGDFLYCYAFWSNDVLCVMSDNGNGAIDVNCWNSNGGMEAKEIPVNFEDVYNITPYSRLNIQEGETDGCAMIVGGTELIYSNDMWSTIQKVTLPEEFCYDMISLEENLLIGGENGYYSLDCYELGETKRSTYTLGDVDNNSEIEAADALAVLKAVVKLNDLTDEQKQAADVDGNGEVNAEDALYILKKVVKLIDKFPGEI